MAAVKAVVAAVVAVRAVAVVGRGSSGGAVVRFE